MSLTTSEMSPADIAAVTRGSSDGFGGFGDNGWWIILLFLCLGGWGNGFGGGSNGGAGGLYPWLNQSDNINEGFRDQMLNDNITSIRDGVYGLSNQLCNCCGDMQMALANGFYNSEISANNRQMANMNQNFALQSQLSDCCCENRLATNDLKYTIATEACQSRAASTANTQAILDKLCQLELDNVKAQLENKNDIISQLRSDLIYAKGQASQDVQTAQILAGQTAEVDALYNRLNNCPVNTVPVYGKQPIFTCNNNSCGCGSF